MAAQVLDLHAAQLVRACEAIEGVHIVRKDGALVLFLRADPVAAPLVFERCQAMLCIMTGTLQRLVPVRLVQRSENGFDLHFLGDRRLTFEIFRADGCSSNIQSIRLASSAFSAEIPNSGYEYRISMGF